MTEAQAVEMLARLQEISNQTQAGMQLLVVALALLLAAGGLWFVVKAGVHRG